MKESIKNELKMLHKRDSKLALEVAQALGYKLTVKAANKKALKKVAIDPLNKASEIVLKVINDLEANMQKALPANLDKLSLSVLVYLKKFKEALYKL